MNIIEEARKYALDEIEKYGTPIMIHFELSESKALELAEKFDADKKIVQLGAILMDLKLGQALKEDRIKEHVKMSSDAAKEFLEKSDLTNDEKEKVINCIDAHHGTIPYTCVEAEICANADSYRFLHPKGVLAYFTLLGKRLESIQTCIEQAESKLEEKHNIISLDICKEELEPYYQQFKKLFKEARK